VLALVAFGLSTFAIGDRCEALAGQAGGDQLALLRTPYPVFGGPIPTHMIRDTPERDFARSDPALIGAGGPVGSRPVPASPGSSAPLVLVGLSLIGGAVFMRRITPGQLRSLGPAVAPSPAVNLVPVQQSPRSTG
jgi:hypothetical protein